MNSRRISRIRLGRDGINMSTIHQEKERLESSPSSIWQWQFLEVERILRAIAQGDDSAGQVHALRIVCRRTEAVLRLGRDAAKSRGWRWLQRNLHDLRQSTNALRDDDVLRKWLAENEMSSTRLQRQLKQNRRPLMHKVARRVRWLLRRERLVRRARQVHKNLKSLDGPIEASAVFGRGLARELSRFIEVLPSRQMDSDQLHQARIACKRLRYAVDAVAEIHPAMDLRELHELLKSLQKHLGSLNDGVVRRRRLKQLKSPQAKQRDHAAGRREKIAAFRAWWQAQPLERILADATAEIVSLMRTGQRDTP